MSNIHISCRWDIICWTRPGCYIWHSPYSCIGAFNTINAAGNIICQFFSTATFAIIKYQNFFHFVYDPLVFLVQIRYNYSSGYYSRFILRQLMMKKLLILMWLCTTPLIGTADEISTDLMILNNSNSQQFNDIWSRMRAGFKLDHTQNDRVKYFEKVYTKNPKSFNKLMNNAIPYLYFLLSETERNGLPAELALIPGIESSYDPLAKNPTDAYA